MLLLKRSEIAALVDLDEAAVAVERAYRTTSQGKVNLPPVGHIAFPERKADCHIKYGHVAGDEVFVIKVATGFPQNRIEGLSGSNGLSLVMSAENGEVLAVLHDEMLLTDIRTGIGGAVASRLLCRPEARHILIAGTGTQTAYQVEAHAALLGPAVEFAIWGRSAERAQAIEKAMSDRFQVRSTSSLAEACEAADIIVTATAAQTSFVERDWIKPGTHITAVGADAPGKQELSSDLIAAADRLFADKKAQCLDHGEFSVPFSQGFIAAEQVAELGTVLSGVEPGRKSDTEITIADLTGLAAQDIAMAKLVMQAHAAKTKA
ncbi:MAG: ornithine cyclodeaminase family protein [Geminicoccales bacterium]